MFIKYSKEIQGASSILGYVDKFLNRYDIHPGDELEVKDEVAQDLNATFPFLTLTTFSGEAKTEEKKEVEAPTGLAAQIQEPTEILLEEVKEETPVNEEKLPVKEKTELEKLSWQELMAKGKEAGVYKQKMNRVTLLKLLES